MHCVTLAFQLKLPVLMFMLLGIEADTFESLPSISRKSTRKDMNVIEAGFERFIKHMCVVILKLLCTLYRDEIIEAAGEAIHIILIVSIKSVT